MTVRLRFMAPLVAAACIVSPSSARAQLAPPSPGMEALEKRPDTTLSLKGYLRVRGDVFYNLDLDRGPTPYGSHLFPLPASNPKSQVLQSADMRVRLEPAWRLTRSVRVVMQVDLLDNVVLGSTPAGLPRDRWTPMSGATLSQSSPESGKNSWNDAVIIRRAWGEVLLPFGVLAVGRQGALMNWGTGFFINAGNDLDHDRSDSADRIVFATSLADHLWMFAFEWSASGPTSAGAWPADQPFDQDGRDDVRTFAFGFARWHSGAGVRRRVSARVPSVNYGLIASYRRQELDVPGYYAPSGLEGFYDRSAVVQRDLHTVSADLWFRVVHRSFRLEFEAAVVWGRIGDASPDPGISMRQAITSLQYGGVLQVAWAPGGGGVSLGLELGLASGDPQPGFGVRSPLDQTQAVPGDLDGPQFRLPQDAKVDNFRFHPNYHVDLILFRRIIGTVSDALYLRPWVRWQSRWGLSLELVAISSFAMRQETPPGGERPLGVEIDLGARYRFDRGFVVRLGFGTLFPLAGLDNVALGLRAKPAVTLHAVMGFVL
ncbi:MAG: TIGR04551 family protein [bacterium]